MLYASYASFVLCMCAIFGQLNAAAIPMWEYLTKQEKMSYLYSMFANQVDDFCLTANLANCNQELLKYGLGKLKDMPEDHLDTMDPYQRGANDIIWGSMMEGHEMMKTTPRPLYPAFPTTAKPNSYEDESFGDYSVQTAASAKIDNVYRVPPPKGYFIQLSTGTPQYTYPHNVVPYLNTFDQINKKGFRIRPTERYLEGPMVVRVHPDGSPVREEGYKGVPQDEDLRQYKLSKVQIPNL